MMDCQNFSDLLRGPKAGAGKSICGFQLERLQLWFGLRGGHIIMKPTDTHAPGGEPGQAIAKMLRMMVGRVVQA